MKMKKTAALLLSLTLTMSVFAACDKEKAKETEPSETTEEEITEETTAGETTTEETTETSESEILIANLSSYDDLTPDEAYEKLRSFATELEQKNNEVGLYYGFFDQLQDGKHIWILGVSNGVNDFAYYTSVDGEMKDVSEEYSTHMPDNGVFPFNHFMKFPCIIDLEYLGEIDEFAESLDDGVYYGNVLAVTENADKMMVDVWTSVKFSPKEYSALKVGDMIFEDEYEEIYVESIDDDGNVRLSNMDFCLEKDESPEGNGNYILTYYGIPIADHSIIALVSVDPDCKIEDHFEWLYTEIDGYEDYLNDNPDLTAVEKSVYWYGESNNEYIDPLSNGWRESGAMLNPVVIENNTIVEVCFDFR